MAVNRKRLLVDIVGYSTLVPFFMLYNYLERTHSGYVAVLVPLAAYLPVAAVWHYITTNSADISRGLQGAGTLPATRLVQRPLWHDAAAWSLTGLPQDVRLHARSIARVPRSRFWIWRYR
jgi:hypothetical protein